MIQCHQIRDLLVHIIHKFMRFSIRFLGQHFHWQGCCNNWWIHTHTHTSIQKPTSQTMWIHSKPLFPADSPSGDTMSMDSWCSRQKADLRVRRNGHERWWIGIGAWGGVGTKQIEESKMFLAWWVHPWLKTCIKRGSLDQPLQVSLPCSFLPQGASASC